VAGFAFDLTFGTGGGVYLPFTNLISSRPNKING
jgi:hypothetical protein